ncbi:hypothetical protein H5410_052779 [Solanum commersonii]|uniref:Uncharacterized protein n=1 Tax=Solanum commersonii TaxID=4109 RepID=A0A9J5X555_SOLCO|nr:hypothetical protein H5410_052779 [Solanum commersonii]
MSTSIRIFFSSLAFCIHYHLLSYPNSMSAGEIGDNVKGKWSHHVTKERKAGVNSELSLSRV